MENKREYVTRGRILVSAPSMIVESVVTPMMNLIATPVDLTVHLLEEHLVIARSPEREVEKAKAKEKETSLLPTRRK